MIFRSEPIKVKFANGRQCFVATISPTKRKDLEARFKSKITSVTGAPKASSSKPAQKKSGRTYPTGSAWQKEHHNYNKAEKSERKPEDRKKPARNVKKKAELGAKVDLHNGKIKKDGSFVVYIDSRGKEHIVDGSKVSAEEYVASLVNGYTKHFKSQRKRLEEIELSGVDKGNVYAEGGEIKKKAELGAKVDDLDNIFFLESVGAYFNPKTREVSPDKSFPETQSNNVWETTDEFQFALSDEDRTKIYLSQFSKDARSQAHLDEYDNFMSGGKTKRKRRTKAEIAHDNYVTDVMSYKWFIVDLEKTRAIDGYEYKEDAVETLEGDFGKFPKEQKTHKLMSERSLKTAGIENPKERWAKADWAAAGMKTLNAEKISTSLNVPANYIKDHKGVGGLIAATLALYVGYKIGRMRPQKVSFETEKKVGKAIGKGAAAAGRATASGAKKAAELMSKAGEKAQASYAARAMKEGGKTSAGYKVFNYTDNIEASAETFKTKKAANDFIKAFRKRYEKQGYYRDNRWRQINPADIDLEVIPSDFNPFAK